MKGRRAIAIFLAGTKLSRMASTRQVDQQAWPSDEASFDDLEVSRKVPGTPARPRNGVVHGL